jgi:hypothetical protein
MLTIGSISRPRARSTAFLRILRILQSPYDVLFGPMIRRPS